MNQEFISRLIPKNPKLILILGGSNSGKSEIAERLSLALNENYNNPNKVVYAATAPTNWVKSDNDFYNKVNHHIVRRKDFFDLLEVGDSVANLVNFLKEDKVCLVDSISTWLGVLNNDPDAQKNLIDVLKNRNKLAVFVSDEVGLSIHPDNRTSIVYRETLGKFNQQLSDVSDVSMLAVAGKIIVLQDIFKVELD